MASVPDTAEPNDTTRAELQDELDRLRTERRTLAANLAGEDPDDSGVGDSGDQAQGLEGEDDLSRMDRRIREIEHLVTGAADRPTGLVDGTVVTLRFPGGDVATLRAVTIPEQADGDEALTTDSPLGRAVVGHGPGDTITYSGPDGELQAEIVDLELPAG